MLDQHASLCESFRWQVPANFNIGQECCHRWTSSSADARRIALLTENACGERGVWTYERLGATANQLSNGLLKMGVKRGDRVAVIVSQRAEAVIAHIAIYSIGAVVLPISTQLAPKAMEYRLRDAEARVALIDAQGANNLLPILQRCHKLTQLVGIDVPDERVLPWRSLLIRQSDSFKPVQTAANDPALLLYTSGATGPARGVLLPHSTLMGNLTGFVASQNWFPANAEAFWTPIDWSRASGLFCGVLPALYFGVPLIGVCEPLGLDQVPALIERYRVSHALLPASILKQWAAHLPRASVTQLATLKHLASCEETLSASVVAWCEHVLGTIPNEIFSQTELACVVGDSNQKWPKRVGSLGRCFPGHRVVVLREDGTPATPGEVGELAIFRHDPFDHPDPVTPLLYWRNEAASLEFTTTGWWRTGDLVQQDSDGYFWFAGRRSRLASKPKAVG
jgi:acetyl-CoA synthetase